MERERSFFKAVQPVRAARFKGGEKTQQMGDRATPQRRLVRKARSLRR